MRGIEDLERDNYISSHGDLDGQTHIVLHAEFQLKLTQLICGGASQGALTFEQHHLGFGDHLIFFVEVQHLSHYVNAVGGPAFNPHIHSDIARLIEECARAAASNITEATTHGGSKRLVDAVKDQLGYLSQRGAWLFRV